MIKLYQGKENLLESTEQNNAISVVKKKIEGFFDMKNVFFLFGSGTSSGAIPKMSVLAKEINDYLGENADEAKKKFYDRIAKKNSNNLEEILGVLYSKRSYLEGIEMTTDIAKKNLSNCRELIDIIESFIFSKLNVTPENEKFDRVMETYKKFYKRMALRNKDHSRICVFTTNNDLFNERALDSQSIHYINGFSGGLIRFFNPALFNYTMSKRMDTSIDKFEPIENMIYLYKIHGSVNWVEETERSSNSYFKIRELPEPKREKTVLIYPTPLKQNKSLGSPYMDLFREFQHKLLEPNSVLFVIGYSFSDEHVNDIIYRALATNSTMNLFIFGNLSEDKEICHIADNRIFRLLETEAEGVPLHYFERIVEELLPDLDAFRQEEELLKKFVQELDASRNLKAK